ncbi:hypothetical protein JTB14_020726 [Gonioctena quinquepunctata]|nr:hypothetical protein JTB14_020726 [Gonioctena quinquepunctata]
MSGSNNIPEKTMPEIKNLDELIGQYIDKNKKIVDTNITRLTAPGDNYGSEMLRVDLILKDGKSDKREDLSVVAKLIPETEFFRYIFNIQVAFNAERNFYATVVPTLQEFQKTQGITEVIDCFPKFYGARTNLKNDDGDIDDDAVIVMENLKVLGFITADRSSGFDYSTTKLLLRDIAKFHAVPLGLKLKDPQTFEKKIKVNLACFLPQNPKEKEDKAVEILVDKLKRFERIKHIIPKFEKVFRDTDMFPEIFREPFSTLVHRDLWVNNIMIRFENGKVVDVKLVDFQGYSYESPAIDLFFFLVTSVEKETLKNHFDDLLKCYHGAFIETLNLLKCDASPFSYDLFMEEIAYGVLKAIGHSILMLAFIIQVPEGGVEKSDDPTEPPNFEAVEIGADAEDKICWVLEECDRRGWLN